MEARPRFFHSADLPDDQEEPLEGFRQGLGLCLANICYVWMMVSILAVFAAGCCAVGYAAVLLLRFLAKLVLFVTS